MKEFGVHEKSLMDKFNNRISEIHLYHSRFGDFRPGDEVSAVTYAMIMRSQVQDLLDTLEEVTKLFSTSDED